MKWRLSAAMLVALLAAVPAAAQEKGGQRGREAANAGPDEKGSDAGRTAEEPFKARSGATQAQIEQDVGAYLSFVLKIDEEFRVAFDALQSLRGLRTATSKTAVEQGLSQARQTLSSVKAKILALEAPNLRYVTLAAELQPAAIVASYGKVIDGKFRVLEAILDTVEMTPAATAATAGAAVQRMMAALREDYRGQRQVLRAHGIAFSPDSADAAILDAQLLVNDAMLSFLEPLANSPTIAPLARPALKSTFLAYSQQAEALAARIDQRLAAETAAQEAAAARFASDNSPSARYARALLAASRAQKPLGDLTRSLSARLISLADSAAKPRNWQELNAVASALVEYINEFQKIDLAVNQAFREAR